MSMHYRRRSKKDAEGGEKSQSPMYRAFNIALELWISLAVSLFT